MILIPRRRHHLPVSELHRHSSLGIAGLNGQVTSSVAVPDTKVSSSMVDIQSVTLEPTWSHVDIRSHRTATQTEIQSPIQDADNNCLRFVRHPRAVCCMACPIKSRFSASPPTQAAIYKSELYPVQEVYYMEIFDQHKMPRETSQYRRSRYAKS